MYFQLTAPAPAWAVAPGKPTQGYPWSQEPNPTDFNQFVEAVATRYSGHDTSRRGARSRYSRPSSRPADHAPAGAVRPRRPVRRRLATAEDRPAAAAARQRDLLGNLERAQRGRLAQPQYRKGPHHTSCRIPVCRLPVPAVGRRELERPEGERPRQRPDPDRRDRIRRQHDTAPIRARGGHASARTSSRSRVRPRPRSSARRRATPGRSLRFQAFRAVRHDRLRAPPVRVRRAAGRGAEPGTSSRSPSCHGSRAS